jgi:hypothetical protein
MSRDEAIKALSGATWKYAKTMPQFPHDYTLKESWHGRAFEDVVVYIRENGYVKKFSGREYKYLDCNGYSYWTMGSPIDKTILINRAVTK